MISRKVPSFIEILPDELFFHTLARFFKNNKTLPFYKITNLLFNRPSANSFNLLIPSYFNSTIESLGNVLTKEEILSKNTIYNLLSPFYDDSLFQKVQEESYNRVTVGMNRYSHKINSLRYCPSCIIEDLKKYQIPYPHSFHHLPGLSICPVHHDYLKEYHSEEDKKDRCFYTLELNRLDLSSTKCKDPRLIEVAELVGDLFKSKFNEFNLELSSLRLKEHLIENNYSTIFRIYYKNLYADFIDFYKDSELIDQFFQKNPSYKVFQQEVYRMVHQKLNVSSIKWVMMINFLSSSIEEFYYSSDSTDLEEYFFGPGPWPCYNPVCPHYNENIIDEVIMHQTQFGATGVFKCECGMYYSKVSGSNNINILQYGELWTHKLQEYLDSGMEEDDICQKLKIGPYALKNFISKMNPTPVEDRIRNSVKTLQDLLKENPELSRKEFQYYSTKDYNYLINYDRNLLDELLPLQMDRGTKTLGNSVVDWEKRDQELCQKLPDIINQILKTRPPIRVSYANVFRALNEKPKLEMLPMFKQMLDDNYENFIDFNIRRLTIIGKEILSQGKELNKSILRKQISHKNKNKEYILEKVYQNLNLE